MKNFHAMRIAAAFIMAALAIHPAVLLACAQGEGTGRAMTAGEIAKLRKDRARQEAFLAPAVKTLNKTCGTRIAAKIEWHTVGLDPTSAANYCSQALDAVARLCADASGQADMSGKQAIMKQIQAVNGKIFGVIVNAIEPDQRGGGHYDSYYDYSADKSPEPTTSA